MLPKLLFRKMNTKAGILVLLWRHAGLFFEHTDKMAVGGEGEVVSDNTKKMKQLKKETILSKPVILTMDYVYEHLHEKIKLEEIAGTVPVSFLNTLIKWLWEEKER